MFPGPRVVYLFAGIFKFFFLFIAWGQIFRRMWRQMLQLRICCHRTWFTFIFKQNQIGFFLASITTKFPPTHQPGLFRTCGTCRLHNFRGARKKEKIHLSMPLEQTCVCARGRELLIKHAGVYNNLPRGWMEKKSKSHAARAIMTRRRPRRQLQHGKSGSRAFL